MMSEKTLMRPSRSLTMDSISPEDLPRQGDSPVLFSDITCRSLIGSLLIPPCLLCFSGVSGCGSAAGTEVPGPVHR